MSERDPRLAPRPGDVLSKGSRIRTVTVVLYASFVCRTEEDSRWRSRPNGLMREVSSNIRQWRKWAATATVVRRAEEAQ